VQSAIRTSGRHVLSAGEGQTNSSTARHRGSYRLMQRGFCIVGTFVCGEADERDGGQAMNTMSWSILGVKLGGIRAPAKTPSHPLSRFPLNCRATGLKPADTCSSKCGRLPVCCSVSPVGWKCGHLRLFQQALSVCLTLESWRGWQRDFARGKLGD
jgi:hypothetical protein